MFKGNAFTERKKKEKIGNKKDKNIMRKKMTKNKVDNRSEKNWKRWESK